MSAPPDIASPGAFGDYLRGDAEANGTPFPFVRRRGPLALIGVSSAVPTAPLMATGRLGRAQLDALDRTLAQLSSEQAFRVLLVHHPLHSDSRIKRLTDSRQLRALLKRHGVELVLHGHDHIHSTMWFEGTDGQIPAIGVPSASALAHRHYPAAAYNLFSIERDGDRWRCVQTVRGIGDDLRVRRNSPDHPGLEIPQAANSATPNSAAAPSRKPSTNIPKPPRRGFSSATGSAIGVATIACSRSIMRRAT